MVRDNRVTVRLGDWEPPQQYNQPQLEPNSEIREVEHEVLGDVTVIQQIGEQPDTFTLRGDAYAEDIGTLREMNGDEVEIRHPIHSGDVVLRRVSANSTGAWDTGREEEEIWEKGVRGTNTYSEKKWVYNYTVELVSVV